MKLIDFFATESSSQKVLNALCFKVLPKVFLESRALVMKLSRFRYQYFKDICQKCYKRNRVGIKTTKIPPILEFLQLLQQVESHHLLFSW